MTISASCFQESYAFVPHYNCSICTASKPLTSVPSTQETFENKTNLPQRPNLRPAMCETEMFKSHTCPHQWMTIVKPCGPHATFKNKMHQYKPARSGLKRLGQPEYISAPTNSCPNCDKKGDYDASTTRFILKKPWEAGNMGNGYNMTDGRGNVLQPRYTYGGYAPPGSSYASCGVTRVSVPQQPWEQTGCCTVM